MPAVPKKKHSKARSKRRSSLYVGRYGRHLPAVSTCPHCRQPKSPQRVCANCGYHKGREMITPKSVAQQG